MQRINEILPNVLLQIAEGNFDNLIQDKYKNILSVDKKEINRLSDAQKQGKFKRTIDL